MKRPDMKNTDKSEHVPVADDGFTKKYPTLHMYLTDAAWEDGSSRECSTISLFVEEGRFKAAMNDKALKRSVYVAADTLTGVLQALEKAVGSPEADWRAWGKNTRKK